MPAAYSHYRLGKKVISQLKYPLKKIILDNRDLFDLGLHGPDILFYNRPYIHSKINRLGSAMHQEKACIFFNRALSILKKSQNEAQFAYLCGFICHFILDSNCHGYINIVMEETKLTHFEIETELDRDFMLKDDRDPLRTHLTDHILINDRILNTIEPFFEASKKDLKKSLKGMKFYDHLLVAPQLYKRGVIYFVLLISFTYKRFQGFIVNYRANKKIIPYINYLEDLFNKSIDESIICIYDFIDALKNNNSLSKRFNVNYK